jgi:transposase-like protein
MTDTNDTTNPKPHIRHYSADDKARLKQLVNDGMAVKQEIDTLNDGLNDTIKAIAEEMEIKPGMLKRVINVAYKRNLGDARAEFEELEDIITTLGLD